MLRALITIKDEDGAVVAWDFDRLAGGGALVGQIQTWIRIVVWDSFADGLPGRLDGLDVEGWVAGEQRGAEGSKLAIDTLSIANNLLLPLVNLVALRLLDGV